MNISKQKDTIIVLIGFLWIVCIVAGTMGHFVFAMCVGVLLMLLHMMLGVAKKGVVSKKFLLYPLGIWAVLWLVSFISSGYYATLFGAELPNFTILGFHPSFAPTIFLYWIGGMLTLNLGLYICSDEWLSKSEWDAFCKRVKDLEGVK